MAKHDIEIKGVTAGVNRYRVAASATRGYAGEPVMHTPTYTTGVSSTNTIIVVSDNKPTIGTDDFVGVLVKDMTVNSSGTVLVGYERVACPIPYCTRLRGKAETSGNIDTQTELTGVLFDLTRFHLASSAYRIQAGGEADTGGLQIVDGNISRGTLDVVVDARAMRSDVTA